MARPAKPYLKDGWYVTSIGGKQHQKLCRAKEGLDEAQDRLDLLKAEIVTARRGGGLAAVTALLSPRPAATVSEALDEFLDFKEVNTKRKGTYEWLVNKLQALRDRYHDWALAAVTDREVTEYKTWLLNEKTWRKHKEAMLKKGLSATTVNMHLRAARAFFAWCYKPSRRQRFALAADAYSPFSEITFLEGRERRRTADEKEFRCLLAACKDGGVRGGALDMQEQLLLLRHTAMRPQELRQLKWEFIDWDNHLVVFPAGSVKTGRERDVPLIDEALEVLKARKVRLERLGLRLTGRPAFALAAKVDGVLTAGAGEEMRTAAALCKRFRALVVACVRAGDIEEEKDGERLVPYSLRHTRGTEMFEEGNEQYVVQHVMGHTSPRTTEKYKHVAGASVARRVRERAAAARAVKPDVSA